LLRASRRAASFYLFDVGAGGWGKNSLPLRREWGFAKVVTISLICIEANLLIEPRRGAIAKACFKGSRERRKRSMVFAFVCRSPSQIL
jgi:hypothetical protein